MADLSSSSPKQPVTQQPEDSNDFIEILEEGSEKLPHTSKKPKSESMSNEAHTSNPTTAKIKFGCVFCNAAFTLVADFYRHLHFMHEVDPFKFPIQCVTCGEVCRTGQKFMYHRETVHSTSQRKQYIKPEATRRSKLAGVSEGSVSIPVIDITEDEGDYAVPPVTDMDLREDQQTTKQANGPQSSNPIKIKRNIPSGPAIANIECKDCDLKFESFADLGEHQREEHKKKEENLDLNRSAEKVLKSNITTRAGSAFQSSKRVQAESPKCTKRCKKIIPENGKNKLSSDSLVCPTKKDSTKTDNVSRCKFRGVFLSSENLKVLLKSKFENWDFHCKICERPYFEKDQLNEHMRITHKKLTK